MKEVRVRFAPSPTGPLHIGGVRTALYNYLFAKKLGGKFIIRIEDTDQNRLIPGAKEYILNSLKWLGIEHDEGPDKVNYKYGPYEQSARKDLGFYKIFANKLIEKGFAYYAFDTEEDLETERNLNPKIPFSYNHITRNRLKNSLTLSSSETDRLLKENVKYVIRFKINKNEEIRFNDLIRGNICVNSSTLDDKVLMKSDGMPTYHLANIVDDHMMDITHVIRGEEWLPSAPFHILLYKALELNAPEFAHLSLILSPDGKGKLSKRDGDKHGFPIFPLSWDYIDEKGEKHSITGFKEEGYLKESLFNYLTFNDKNNLNDTVENIINNFDLFNLSKSGARFDINKLKNINGQYLKLINDHDVYFDIIHYVSNNLKYELKFDKIAWAIIPLVKERAVFTSDFIKDIDYFFVEPIIDETNLYTPNFSLFLNTLEEISLESLSGHDIKVILLNLIKDLGFTNGEILKPLRYLITGLDKGPELDLIIDILGPEEFKNRIF